MSPCPVLIYADQLGHAQLMGIGALARLDYNRTLICTLISGSTADRARGWGQERKVRGNRRNHLQILPWHQSSVLEGQCCRPKAREVRWNLRNALFCRCRPAPGQCWHVSQWRKERRVWIERFRRFGGCRLPNGPPSNDCWDRFDVPGQWTLQRR